MKTQELRDLYSSPLMRGGRNALTKQINEGKNNKVIYLRPKRDYSAWAET